VAVYQIKSHISAVGIEILILFFRVFIHAAVDEQLRARGKKKG